MLFFFSERAFAIATKVPLRQPFYLFGKKRENRGDSCTGCGQTWPVFSSENMLVFWRPLRAREGSLRKKRENTCKLPKNVIIKNMVPDENTGQTHL